MWVRNARELFQDALRRGYALPAFNIASLEMAQACLQAAESLGAPIILQTYREEVRRVSPEVFRALVQALAERTRVPVLLHLDHGEDWGSVFQAFRAGYGSAMWDASGLPLERVVQEVRGHAPLVQAMGGALEVAAEGFSGEERSDPEAVQAVREAGADVVAVAVGSRHGQASRLDLDLLARIAERAGGPLALHGGSGIHPEDLKAAVAMGVAKVNVGTALYRAFLSLLAQPWPHHRAFYRAAEVQMAEVAKVYIQRVQAEGKA
ncbi:class II fructose-bisphosphate aldolase [Thermus scotoductus]|uniref:Tagatose-bisphosphate aldolase n=1 Tax=Thermus scotoductus TaxID=37636 RepID=A0A430RQD2_THESC|nr:class II fructose-bisphosphate aldolase [Thermus scotoductus]RTH21302.1 Tagatose-bisphosphate aldolase [Thermus scotoductus]RTI33976.1 Tagatose-bisphosphate aldolase [Thermus scotoductus]